MSDSSSYKYSSADPVELVRQLASGNELAFKALYDMHFLPLFRFAKKFVENRQIVEDITTECFLKLWEKRSDFDNPHKLRSFLFTTVRNACLNYRRDEKRHSANHEQLLATLSSQTENDLAQHQITETVLQHIQDEIDKLPAKMKNILRLHIQGIKNEEIAAELGITEKTVRNLKVEALKQLRIAVLKNDLIILLLLWHCLCQSL